jgi:hypothetical protein
MAGDWIKMRVWLCRDPKVIRMADWLMAEPRFMNAMGLHPGPGNRNVMRNVTVALCVTGLLVTWGTAREQGDRENDDLVLRHCRIETLSAMCDVPFFGEAMASVDWAVERGDGSVVFPKFFKDNESPDDRHKRQNAERQARFRESHSNEQVTAKRNVTVTTEKRREESLNKKREPLAEPTTRHQEIASGFGLNCAMEFAKFKDNNEAKGLTWKSEDAAFRNWLRKAKDFKPQKHLREVSAGDWWRTESGVSSRAKQLGLSARAGESMDQFISRLHAAARPSPEAA